MANIALIPARGGSKRIPKKNIRDFLGKPIIAYTIEAARESNCFDRIIVSTDCPDIRKVAISYGAEVPFERPQEFSDDYSTTNDVIKHALRWVNLEKIKCNYLCCLYATAPFITPTLILEGLQALESRPDASYAIPITSFAFPIQRAVKILDNRLQMFTPQYALTRSQDLEESYHDTGQFYWGKPTAFLNNVPFFSDASVPIICPRHMVQDIDTQEDWVRAERLYKLYLIEKGDIPE